jgi:hypothetical protein
MTPRFALFLVVVLAFFVITFVIGMPAWIVSMVMLGLFVWLFTVFLTEVWTPFWANRLK